MGDIENLKTLGSDIFFYYPNIAFDDGMRYLFLNRVRYLIAPRFLEIVLAPNAGIPCPPMQASIRKNTASCARVLTNEDKRKKKHVP